MRKSIKEVSLREKERGEMEGGLKCENKLDKEKQSIKWWRRRRGPREEGHCVRPDGISGRPRGIWGKGLEDGGADTNEDCSHEWRRDFVPEKTKGPVGCPSDIYIDPNWPTQTKYLPNNTQALTFTFGTLDGIFIPTADLTQVTLKNNFSEDGEEIHSGQNC